MTEAVLFDVQGADKSPREQCLACEPVVITPSGNDVDYSTKDPRHGITKSTFKSLSLKIRPLQWPALRRLLTGRRCINQNKHTQKGSKQISDHDIC